MTSDSVHFFVGWQIVSAQKLRNFSEILIRFREVAVATL